MSFLARVARGAEFRSATTGLANPAGWLVDALVSSRTESGQRVTPQTALGVIPVYGAISLVSGTVRKIPLKVYRNLDGEKMEQRDHRGWRMLHDAPNPQMPAGRFWQLITVHKLLYGNAMAEMRRTDGFVVDELWPLDPVQTTIKWDGTEKTFVVREGQKNERRIAGDDVLHFMDVSLDGIVGISRITQCKLGIGAVQARDQFESRFYRQGAVMSGIVEHPGKPDTQEATKNLRDSLAGIYGGSEKAHQIGVLWEGANFRPAQMALRDLEFVQTKQLSATDIAVLFNLPPNKLGGLTGDSMTYGNVEMNQIQFVQEAIEPVTVEIQETISQNVSMFPQTSYFAEFELEALMRGDHQARATYYKDMSTVKAITVNEIRARENLPPIDGGDEIGSSIPETARETIPDPNAQPLATGDSNVLALPARVAE
jgi:HK97 family phage portal protein